MPQQWNLRKYSMSICSMVMSLARQYSRQERLFMRNKYTNTWGAYQCYGDQFYTLRSVTKKAKAKEYVIAREAEIDLNNLLNKLEVSGYSKDSLLQELDDIS